MELGFQHLLGLCGQSSELAKMRHKACSQSAKNAAQAT
jgi:hypothetical protein